MQCEMEKLFFENPPPTLPPSVQLHAFLDTMMLSWGEEREEVLFAMLIKIMGAVL